MNRIKQDRIKQDRIKILSKKGYASAGRAVQC
jgi:hypothetical protein